MRIFCFFIATTVIATAHAGETTTSKQKSDMNTVMENVVVDDFIVPFANDIRIGYSANFGRYHRSQSGNEGTDSHFIEHGAWASYTCALSPPGRALAGLTEWRAEIGILASLADVVNPNGSTGTLQTAMLDLGFGPSWALINRNSNRLEIEIMPIAGVGLARYENYFTTDTSGFTGSTTINTSGVCLEYGIKANLMWCWSNGWGVALHAGIVQRESKLDGDSTTHWNNGVVIRSDYLSEDILSGMRFGLFVARRF